MSQLGIGAMLHYLSGGSANDPTKYAGRKIVDAKFDAEDNKDHGGLILTFEDGVTIHIWDNGQSCCESRYITTDDDPKGLVGQVLLAIETRPAPEAKPNTEYSDVHEAVFIDVKTDLGVGVTLCCHVDHNGYYGGFGLTITEGEKRP